jgi:uncharacterized membrane protein
MADRPNTARQQGAYTLLTVFVLLMSLGALGVLAVGHVAWEKSRIQGVADLVALTAARQMADGPTFAEARAIARANGVGIADQLAIVCVINNAVTADCANAITARVTVNRSVTGLMAFFSSRQISAIAEATVAPTVVGTVSSSLATVNTNQSALLNGLLTGLGGGAVNLSVAQWGALLGSDIAVDLLALSTELGVASLNELLALNVSALGLLQDALLVGDAEQADKMQIQGVLSALSGPLNRTNLRVGDLLAVDLSGRTDTPLDVNLGQLAQVALLNSVRGVGYTLPITSGLLNLNVGVNILQAPQVFVGRKTPFKDPITTARTAQVALNVRVRQPLNINIALVSLSALDLALQLRVAGGLAEVNDLTCRFPRTNNNLAMTVVPALTEVCISQSAGNLNTTVGGLTCGAPARILNVTFLGLIDAGVTAAARASLRADPVEFSFDGVAPFQESVDLNLGQTLGGLLSNTNLDLDVDLPFVGPLIRATVNGLVSTLLVVLEPVLRPILGTVGNILDSLLRVLGVDLNTVTVDVNSMDCQSVVLTR